MSPGSTNVWRVSRATVCRTRASAACGISRRGGRPFRLPCPELTEQVCTLDGVRFLCQSVATASDAQIDTVICRITAFITGFFASVCAQYVLHVLVQFV